MIDNIEPLKHLLKQLHTVPYMASRHIYRVAHHFLDMDKARLEQFCNTLLMAHDQLSKCTLCWAWQEKSSACLFCNHAKRDQHTICVVGTWYDLWALERVSAYQGIYHVLGGLICPLEGIGPDDLTIKFLVERVQRVDSSMQDSQTKEIILALSQTPEGEATAAYIARKLEGMPIRITCLARGVPVGSTLEALDRVTLHKALSERRPF